MKNSLLTITQTFAANNKFPAMNRLQRELEELERGMYDYGWVPRHGPRKKQITPKQIRSAIRAYIAEHRITQTEFQHRIHVCSGSYCRFMNTNYKGAWSACQNDTYWAAARFFAVEDLKKKIAAAEEKSNNKQLQYENPASASPPVTKKSRKEEAEDELRAISAVNVPFNCPVFANCDEVRSKLNNYLAFYGGTTVAWLRAVGAEPHNPRTFSKYKGKGAGAANPVYQKAWRFFEQKRILEGKPKSARRREQEARWGSTGFPLEHDNGVRLFARGSPINPLNFDIEACRDAHNARIAAASAASVA